MLFAFINAFISSRDPHILALFIFAALSITSSAIKRHMPPEKYWKQVAIDRYIIHLNYKQIMSDTRSTRYEEHVPPPDLKGPLSDPPIITSHATNFQVLQPPQRAKKKKTLSLGQKICIKYV